MKEHSDLFNQYKHIFYLFILIFESRIFMGSILHGVPHWKFICCFMFVLRFVLFNFQSLDRVYNKCFGGDNITFYAFPKQSKIHSANHSSSQPLIVFSDFCPHCQSHPQHVTGFPFHTHTSRTWSNKMIFAGISLYHRQHFAPLTLDYVNAKQKFTISFSWIF